MLLGQRPLGVLFSFFFLFGSGCGKRPERVDVCIVVGTSRKYGLMWRDIARGIAALSNSMSVSPSTTRLALITVGSRVTPRIKLGGCTNRECFKAKLKKIRYTPQVSSIKQSATRRALHVASRILEKDGHHDAKKVIFLIVVNPSQTINAYVRNSFANKKIIIVSSGIFRYSRGHISIKFGSSFYKGKALKKKQHLSFAKGSYTKCRGIGKVHDECNRRCDCKHGKMVNCKRVRKEFTELTLNDRRRFIKAFKTLASDKRYKKKYEKFVKIHNIYFFTGIHTQDYFLPWHRWYMLEFENMIREVDCRITIPYWDWAFWSSVSWKENIHIWNKHDYGLGGNGNPEEEYCVQDGPFKEGLFKTPEFDDKAEVIDSIAYVIGNSNIHAHPTKGKKRSGCLRRSFNGKPMGLLAVKKILRHPAGSFATFESMVRFAMHNSIHNEIGGHMCSTFASFSPEFYLHHTFLDKIWFTWQQRSPACMKAKFANSHKKMSRFGCQHSQSELMYSSRLPGHIAVVYSDYYYGKHANRVKGVAKDDSEESPQGNEDDALNDFAYPSAETDPRLFEDSTDEGLIDFGDENSNGFRHSGNFDNEEVSSDVTEDERDDEDWGPEYRKLRDRTADGDEKKYIHETEIVPGDVNGDNEQGFKVEEEERDIDPNDMSLRPIKYGETPYIVWTQDDYSFQTKEQDEICSDDFHASFKRNFVPAFKKNCHTSNDFENI